MTLEASRARALAPQRELRHSGAVNLIFRRWLVVSALASAGALAVAHGFQSFGHLSPCELCLKARDVWWVALAIAIVGIVLNAARPGVQRAVIAVLTVVFIGGLALSIYHAGAEWKFWPGPASCSGGGGAVSVGDIGKMLKGGSAAPSCEKPAWVFLGLSMAGWDAVLFAAMGLGSAVSLRRTPT